MAEGKYECVNVGKGGKRGAGLYWIRIFVAESTGV
jgi:hypothetical protein